MRDLYIKIDKDIIPQLPRYAFDGRIVVVQSEEEANRAVRALRTAPMIGIDTETRPAFKRGEWDKGMVDGVRAAVSVLDGSMQPDAPDDDGDDDILAFTVVLIAIIVMAGIIVAIGSKQKCPKCGKKGMRKTSEKRMTVNLGRGRRKTIIRTTYVCPNCGHVITRDDEQDDDNGLAAGAVLGSMLGGTGGGGGLSGGSFGGGSTGGGGSTSGW